MGRTTRCCGYAVIATIAVALSGCGGGSSGGAGNRTPPDLVAFLQLPVATPTACPSAPAATTGRRSPWVGHVDVSVFVDDDASPELEAKLGPILRSEPHVARVYRETKRQAYAEFQRLYTCSAQVPQSALPASYRLILDAVTTSERNSLVQRIYELPGVRNVSCDPSSPCTGVGPSR